MQRIIQFPNGARLAGLTVSNWSQTSGVITVGLTGLTSTSQFQYTPANEDVAVAMLASIDRWYFATTDKYVIIQDDIGILINSITPNSTAANTPAAIAVAGQQFDSNTSAFIGGTQFPVTFTDSADISIAYDGSLAPTNYDVVVKNTNGASFTLTQGLSLT